MLSESVNLRWLLSGSPALQSCIVLSHLSFSQGGTAQVLPGPLMSRLATSESIQSAWEFRDLGPLSGLPTFEN